MNYRYQNANESDREAIYELYRLVMRHMISEIWGWDEQWQRNDFNDHYDPQGITLVYRARELVGYSHIEKREGHIFIRMLAVHSQHQKNGIGTKLLSSIIELAHKESRKVRLEVFKTNTVAKMFYKKHGFDIEGEIDKSLKMVHA